LVISDKGKEKSGVGGVLSNSIIPARAVMTEFIFLINRLGRGYWRKAEDLL